MNLPRTLRLTATTLAFASLSALSSGCTTSSHQGALPYHSDALTQTAAAPYQRASAAQATPASVARDTGGSVASRPPTGPRRSRPIKGSQAPTSPSHTGTVPTRPDSQAPRQTPGGGYDPSDALAYVLETYRLNGVSFENENDLKIIDLYRAVQREGSIYHTTRPVVGDLVFFHNTFDANRDGRNNDWYSHVGVVEEVRSNGTIVVLSYRAKAVVRDTMNLEHPRESQANGRLANSELRARTRQDPEYTQYLAGELFAGFASVLGDLRDVAVIDDWRPTRK